MEPKSTRGITREDVWRAADELLLEKQRPTIEKVRQKLGRGSPNTVSPHLDTWFSNLGARIKDPGAFSTPPDVPDPVTQAARYLWETALATARADAAAELARQERSVQEEREALAKERSAFVAERLAIDERLNALQQQVIQSEHGRKFAEDQAGRAEALRHAALEELRRAQAQVEQLRAEKEDLRARLEEQRLASDQERGRLLERFDATEKRLMLELDGSRMALRQAQAAHRGELQALRQNLEAAQEELQAQKTALAARLEQLQALQGALADKEHRILELSLQNQELSQSLESASPERTGQNARRGRTAISSMPLGKSVSGALRRSGRSAGLQSFARRTNPEARPRHRVTTA